MNKKLIITALLALVAIAGYADNNKITHRTNKSITFVVDENLTPVDDPYMRMYTGESVAKFMLSEEQIPNDAQRIIATSFSGENNLMHMGKDAFYRCIVKAYANHQSVTLSPDMVWLVISQGFARYVNAHAEELRPKLVNHNGKMDLAIMTNKDLLTEDVDWPSLIADFSSQKQVHQKRHCQDHHLRLHNHRLCRTCGIADYTDGKREIILRVYRLSHSLRYPYRNAARNSYRLAAGAREV